MSLIVKEVTDPFRVRRDKPKYTIECDGFREEFDDESGKLFFYNLHAQGNTLSELLDGARFWIVSQSGFGGYWDAADPDAVEAYITQRLLELQSEERK